MLELTLQLHHHGHWQDAMRLRFLQPEDGLASPCILDYHQPWLLEQLEQLDSIGPLAVASQLPLGWDVRSYSAAPAFLHDIIPAGAARRVLEHQQLIPPMPGVHTDLRLLAGCCISPIGHLRIREAVERQPAGQPIGFSRQEVIERDNRFLEYAYEQGAGIGGATGAGGEAPKLLLVEDSAGLLYPDATLPDEQLVRHWLVKFPRGQNTQTDRDILRSEYCYYQALARLGIASVGSLPGLALEDADKPSLWMPRFDRRLDGAGQLQRLAVESIYSLAGITRPGSAMWHTDAISALVQLWQQCGQQAQIPDLLLDYLRRDLLNKILGNSDNHGRNTAILRLESGLQLAPIYDLAPMVMDAEGITRSTKWPDGIEVAGEVDWRAACQALAVWQDADLLFETLRDAARQLLALPDILNDLQLPQTTFNHPRIPLRRLPQWLQQQGLA